VRLAGLNEETREAVDICLERRDLVALAFEGDNPVLLGRTEPLQETFDAVLQLREFRATDLATLLSITPQNANNRLKRLVEAAALRRRQANVSNRGGKEFVYCARGAHNLTSERPFPRPRQLPKLTKSAIQSTPGAPAVAPCRYRPEPDGSISHWVRGHGIRAGRQSACPATRWKVQVAGAATAVTLRPPISWRLPRSRPATIALSRGRARKHFLGIAPHSVPWSACNRQGNRAVIDLRGVIYPNKCQTRVDGWKLYDHRDEVKGLRLSTVHV